MLSGIQGLALALMVSALPGLASAEALPASVAACATLTDVLQRLACYDREVARFTHEPPTTVAKGGISAIAPTTPAPSAPPAVSAPSKAEPLRVVARIVGIEGHGDDLIVRLDNGQVWEQTQKAEATLGLRPGDRVTIDKGLGGTYWLGGPSQAVMQVKRQP